MKSMRSPVFAALAIALVCGVAWVLASKHQTAQQNPPRPAAVPRTATSLRPKSPGHWTEPRMTHTAVEHQALPQEDAASARHKLRSKPVEPQIAADQNEPPVAQAETVTPQALQTPQGTPTAPKTMQDPMARVALAYVGADPDAETYWYEAINNPSLSAQERQDLIEDLNEDGLSDPQNPTLEDLPLILSRLELIEDVAWDAMDEVNADAFQEAYKDLVNLAIQAMDNG